MFEYFYQEIKIFEEILKRNIGGTDRIKTMQMRQSNW